MLTDNKTSLVSYLDLVLYWNKKAIFFRIKDSITVDIWNIYLLSILYKSFKDFFFQIFWIPGLFLLIFTNLDLLLYCYSPILLLFPKEKIQICCWPLYKLDASNRWTTKGKKTRYLFFILSKSRNKKAMKLKMNANFTKNQIWKRKIFRKTDLG